MARLIKPQGKVVRRFGIGFTAKQQKIVARRNTPPGQHGQNGHPRLSEYGKQLQEKQKAKYIYGVLEKQFRKYFDNALKGKGNTTEKLFQLLEMRLDNVVYRSGFAKTRNQARQLVSHAHITVNGKKVDIPSYEVKISDIIEVRKASKDMKIFKEAQEAGKNYEQTSWINSDIAKLSSKVTDKPTAKDMTGEYDPKMIIEFYSSKK